MLSFKERSQNIHANAAMLDNAHRDNTVTIGRCQRQTDQALPRLIIKEIFYHQSAAGLKEQPAFMFDGPASISGPQLLPR